MRWEIEKLHRDVKALGLEDSSFWRRERLEASGLPHDLHHHDQRCQGADGGAEFEERGGVPQVR
jgi:hypothetical protein